MITKKTINQFLKYHFISGIGWILNLLIFLFFLKKFNIFVSNILSTYITITAVFILSVYKVFDSTVDKKSINYVIYLIYKVLSVFIFSYVLVMIYNLLSKVLDNPVILSKILITPLISCSNFFALKIIIEEFAKNKIKCYYLENNVKESNLY